MFSNPTNLMPWHFAQSITDQAPGYRVTLKVTEVDEKTETTIVTQQLRFLLHFKILPGAIW